LNTLSWIQRYVLTELTRRSSRRYSELKPADVEGNLFMYHLKGLLNDDLIEKRDGRYTLTTRGRDSITTLSLVTGHTRKQPLILTAVVARNDAGEYLWSRWHREPNTGRISFPHGMMHYGESLTDMAALELAEKASLEAELTFRGDVYFRAMRGEKTGRHMLVHIFTASNLRPGRQNEFRPDVSEPFWAQLNSIPKGEFLPGFYEIAQLVDDQPKGPLFADITVEIKD
jgi:ADP-ribose pyrophosphatase YjhB (NUDIX family)